MTQMLASMNMSKSTFSFVPVQDFNQIWTDEALYKKYDLDNEEVELIESSMKPMGD
jgi:site-specific DNA-methyltransferase (adenine-specific)